MEHIIFNIIFFLQTIKKRLNSKPNVNNNNQEILIFFLYINKQIIVKINDFK